MPPVKPRPPSRYIGSRRVTGFRRGQDGAGEAGSAGETTVFRRVLRDLIEARPCARPEPFERTVNEILRSRDPGRCIKVLLEEFANNSGQDGLSLGIDVLSRLGAHTLIAAQSFAEPDFRALRREATSGVAPCLPAHEDVWYMLLRAIARADAPPFQRLTLVLRTLTHPSAIVRTAAVEALGDLAEGGDAGLKRMIRGLLEFLDTKHKDQSVSAAARVVLSDLEG